MLKRTGLALAAVSLMAVSAFAGPIASGLKPGQPVGAFDVVDVNGPNKGKQLCYRCQYGRQPVVAAFIKSSPAESAGLVGGIQKLVEEHQGKGLKSFIVFMGGPELKPAIEKLAAEKKVTVPMTFLPEGPGASDIAAYKINPEAKNTVMLWNKGAVHASVADVTRESWSEVTRAAEEMLK